MPLGLVVRWQLLICLPHVASAVLLGGVSDPDSDFVVRLRSGVCMSESAGTHLAVVYLHAGLCTDPACRLCNSQCRLACVLACGGVTSVSCGMCAAMVTPVLPARCVSATQQCCFMCASPDL
jgi:hypothetical protein